MAIQGLGWNDFPVRAVDLSDGSIEVLTLSNSQANSTYASNAYHVSSAGAVLDGSSYLSPASDQGLGPGFVVYAGAAMPNGAFVFAGLTLGPSPQTSSPVNMSTGSVSVSWSGALFGAVDGAGLPRAEGLRLDPDHGDRSTRHPLDPAISLDPLCGRLRELLRQRVGPGRRRHHVVRLDLGRRFRRFDPVQ